MNTHLASSTRSLFSTLRSQRRIALSSLERLLVEVACQVC
ncbi:hypothetical protein AVDCRST_MAG94-5546 [uncultured Leptolyngbya sp.]|uniref:Uncharacterized protein n=1 Tax=uncultured Leptolyngbya sp. TaxID=332963 RepID=A0A6J4NRR1_9CYAN|nr:hypothetical protein AVDCRST_MAG94-5546 [uncultured Leptolyngbya sp.]